MLLLRALRSQELHRTLACHQRAQTKGNRSPPPRTTLRDSMQQTAQSVEACPHLLSLWGRQGVVWPSQSCLASGEACASPEPQCPPLVSDRNPRPQMTGSTDHRGPNHTGEECELWPVATIIPMGNPPGACTSDGVKALGASSEGTQSWATRAAWPMGHSQCGI